MPKCLPRCLCLSSILLCSPAISVLQAGEKLQILNDIAIQHVANRERIVTWEGKVEVLDRYVRPNETQSATCEVEYALNRADDIYRWTFRQLQVTLTVDGKQVTDVRRYQVGGIRTKEGVTRLDWFDPAKGETVGKQILGIQPPGYFHPGPGSLDFDPMYFFQEGSRSLESTFKQCYDMSEIKVPYRTTTQDGSRVTYANTGNSVNQFTVDLAQGSNLVEALYSESNAQGELIQEIKVNTTYTKSAEICVPSTVVYASRRPKDGTEFIRKFKWTSQTVNGELAHDAFSLATIGAKDGALVSDMRSGLSLAVKDGGLSPIAAAPFQPPVPESHFARWIMILGTCIVVLVFLGIIVFRQRRSANQ